MGSTSLFFFFFFFFVVVTDETVFEVWQPKFVPRDLLDLNELDICLSVYNEAVLECL